MAPSSEIEAACWDKVEEYTAKGRALSAAGNTDAAINCFTRGANVVRDDRYAMRRVQSIVRSALACSKC
jgi:hypothetical protein